MTVLLEFRWTGEAMQPTRANLADKQFVIGELYRMEVVEARSAITHNHFFACLTEAWRNLPDQQAERFPSPDHLRRYALIKSGHHDSQTYVCASKAEALRLAAAIRPIDEFAVVIVNGSTVARFVAKSQSLRAMGKETFQHSKDDVLNFVSELIGVEREALEKAA